MDLAWLDSLGKVAWDSFAPSLTESRRRRAPRRVLSVVTLNDLICHSRLYVSTAIPDEIAEDTRSLPDRRSRCLYKLMDISALRVRTHPRCRTGVIGSAVLYLYGDDAVSAGLLHARETRNLSRGAEDQQGRGWSWARQTSGTKARAARRGFRTGP